MDELNNFMNACIMEVVKKEIIWEQGYSLLYINMYTRHRLHSTHIILLREYFNIKKVRRSIGFFSVSKEGKIGNKAREQVMMMGLFYKSAYISIYASWYRGYHHYDHFEMGFDMNESCSFLYMGWWCDGELRETKRKH